VLILVLDSCASSCTVGVWQDGIILAQASENMERGLDARLLPLVLSVLEKSGKTFDDCDRIAVTRGPGSFTGVRVGLAAARGIGIAANKSVIGVDRFSIYARCAKPELDLLIIIESKRAELFCHFFPEQGAAHEGCMMTQEEIDAFLASHPNTAIAGDKATPDADIIKACAEIAASASSHDAAFAPQPLYLRAPDVTMPAKANA
jgi:tRNA threonylcarbamoyladenosine biosynthesis protein TsaB